MLDLELWELRLKNAHTDIEQIGRAANPALAMKSITKNTSVFVLPGIENAGGNSLTGGAVAQETQVSVGLLIGLKHVAATRSHESLVQLQNIRDQIDEVLLGWQPPDAAYEIEFQSGKPSFFNDKIFFWTDFYRTAFDKRSTNNA